LQQALTQDCAKFSPVAALRLHLCDCLLVPGAELVRALFAFGSRYEAVPDCHQVQVRLTVARMNIGKNFVTLDPTFRFLEFEVVLPLTCNKLRLFQGATVLKLDSSDLPIVAVQHPEIYKLEISWLN
jgi:hypothetical protein